MIREEKQLSHYLLKALSAEQSLEVKILNEKIKKESGKSYSVQGLYKELRNLQKEGVVFKLGNKYSLRLPWVLDFISQSEVLSKTYVERPQLTAILPNANKKEIWHFSNLLKMNDFWSHLLLILLEQSKDKVVLGWNPHPWFHLVQTEKEEQYIKALKLAKSKLYLIVGGNTFLDKWTEKFWDEKVVKYSYGKSDFHKERSLYLNVVDDYVINIKLDSDISHAIDAIYTRTKSMNDLDLPSILSIFNQKTDASIWLEKNPEKAKKIRNKFRKFWGINF